MTVTETRVSRPQVAFAVHDFGDLLTTSMLAGAPAMVVAVHEATGAREVSSTTLAGPAQSVSEYG